MEKCPVVDYDKLIQRIMEESGLDLDSTLVEILHTSKDMALKEHCLTLLEKVVV